MPYVKQERREALYPSFETAPLTAGELNYQLTELALSYMRTHHLTYQSINDVLGAFEGAKQEFYRRVAAPYEDTKIKENGDVYQ